MKPRGIWRTGIYKPALLLGVAGLLLISFAYPDLFVNSFSLSIIIRLLAAFIATLLLEAICYFADSLAINNMNEKIEADLKWAIKIGRKYPQCRALCKELNPMLTDEMMWNYRTKKKRR